MSKSEYHSAKISQEKLLAEIERLAELPILAAIKTLDRAQAKRELVVEISAVDEHGPCLSWHKHWANYPVGTKLYASGAKS